LPKEGDNRLTEIFYFLIKPQVLRLDTAECAAAAERSAESAEFAESTRLARHHTRRVLLGLFRAGGVVIAILLVDAILVASCLSC
jgi:hypothetical protein